MNNQLKFDEEQFNRIFPFYIIIDKGLSVASIGKTMKKLYPNTVGKNFTDSFAIVRPEILEQSFQQFQSLTNQLVIIECRNEQRIYSYKVH